MEDEFVTLMKVRVTLFVVTNSSFGNKLAFIMARGERGRGSIATDRLNSTIVDHS